MNSKGSDKDLPMVMNIKLSRETQHEKNEKHFYQDTRSYSNKPHKKLIPYETSKESERQESKNDNVNFGASNTESSRETLESLGEIIPPKLLKSYNIPYPLQARILGKEGSVVLRLTINTNGEVVNIKLDKTSGSEILDKNTIDHVKKFTFSPAIVEGQPCNFEVYYTVHYVLD